MAKRGSKKKGGRSGDAAIHSHAVRAVVQILVATGRAYTVATLRERLRACFVEEGDYEKRAVASLSTLQLMTALLEAAPALEAVGLQLRLVNGTVRLTTARIESASLGAFLAEERHYSRRQADEDADARELSQAALEVVACIAFKQPLCQAEIDRYFGADKRHVVAVLRETGMVEDFVGAGGRLQFVTTAQFLQRFGLESLEELRNNSGLR